MDFRYPELAYLIDRQLSFKVETFPKGGNWSPKPKHRDKLLLSASESSDISKLPIPEPVRQVAQFSPHRGYMAITKDLSPVTESKHAQKDELIDSTHHRLLSFDHFGHKIASTAQFEALTATHPLPPLTGPRWWRRVRQVCSTYRSLWSLTILSNISIFAALAARDVNPLSRLTYQKAATATGANLLITALTRQEHVINTLFRFACAVPNAAPLCVRRQAAKVYSYGGIHSGCAFSALLWYLVYTILAVQHFEGTYAESVALAATASTTLILLTVITCLSHPYIRKRWHDQWELSHRFGGWTVVGLVWAQTLIIVASKAHRTSRPIAWTILTTPTFWFLILISACLLYPWIRLRRRPVKVEKLSNHAVRLYFDDRTLPTCVGYRLSHAPLFENHGFATIPHANRQKGYSIVVSNAGDWTKRLINSPPQHIWTRGAPTAGVMRTATLFRPIVIVATGSGIGPCLSFLQVHPDHPMRIIWSARSPESTYGRNIMEGILRADPCSVIIDTKTTGHPDLPALTYAICQEIKAEAVVVISNPQVTTNLIFEMKARDIAAFGPIFDS